MLTVISSTGLLANDICIRAVFNNFFAYGHALALIYLVVSLQENNHLTHCRVKKTVVDRYHSSIAHQDSGPRTVDALRVKSRGTSIIWTMTSIILTMDISDDGHLFFGGEGEQLRI